ncbi:MAG TPA: LUD domain-containing protein [Candidatus Aquilonibacter sp.]|nr:LUD domain-containing protein [Candidatus Aquilonibacter sp.]
MSADARSAILAAIRSANDRTTDLTAANEGWERIPRAYQQNSSLSHQETIDLLTERLVDYNASVSSCTADDLSSAMRTALHQHNAHRVLVPSGFPAHLLPHGFEFASEENLSPAELDHFDAAVTLCALAIAETGTLILEGIAGQGRRATTLVPDVHICVLNAADIVTTVPEAFARLASAATLPLTFFSGPSATADIEMTRIKGVHGPRQLHILLLHDAA